MRSARPSSILRFVVFGFGSKCCWSRARTLRAGNSSLSFSRLSASQIMYDERAPGESMSYHMSVQTTCSPNVDSIPDSTCSEGPRENMQTMWRRRRAHLWASLPWQPSSFQRRCSPDPAHVRAQAVCVRCQRQSQSCMPAHAGVKERTEDKRRRTRPSSNATDSRARIKGGKESGPDLLPYFSSCSSLSLAAFSVYTA